MPGDDDAQTLLEWALTPLGVAALVFAALAAGLAVGGGASLGFGLWNAAKERASLGRLDPVVNVVHATPRRRDREAAVPAPLPAWKRRLFPNLSPRVSPRTSPPGGQTVEAQPRTPPPRGSPRTPPRRQSSAEISDAEAGTPPPRPSKVFPEAAAHRPPGSARVVPEFPEDRRKGGPGARLPRRPRKGPSALMHDDDLRKHPLPKVLVAKRHPKSDDDERPPEYAGPPRRARRREPPPRPETESDDDDRRPEYRRHRRRRDSDDDDYSDRRPRRGSRRPRRDGTSDSDDDDDRPAYRRERRRRSRRDSDSDAYGL